MTRRRLLLVTDSLSEGREARHLRAILGRLSRRRFDVRLVSLFGGPPPPDDIERSRVETHHLEAPRSGSLSEVADRLGRFVEERELDVIHAHSPLAAVAARRVLAEKPVVLTVHELPEKPRGEPGSSGSEASALSSLGDGTGRCHCIASTEAIRVRLEGEWRIGDVRVMPPFVDVAGFRERFDSVDRGGARRQWGLQRGEVAVLFVGEIHRRMRPVELLEAFRVALRELRSLRLFMVGEGPELPSVRARAEELDLGDSVMFLSTPHDAPTLFRMADLFVLPRSGEEFPLPLLDAMAAGLPAVIGGEEPVLEAVEAGAALQAREGRAEHFARQMLRLATDPHSRADMGAAAVERAERFDVGRWISRLEGLYAEL